MRYLLPLFVTFSLLTLPGALMAQDAQPAATNPDAAQPAPEPNAQPVPAHTNRLAGETSPYLLQHAHNPVDWFPWGPAAFAEAKRRGVPIFLSVGYSTCYWCHVMERESFEDETTAAFMNAHFVSIKVDREERPDIDDIYMAVVQMLTGSGGWPMSVFLTPPGATGEDDPGLKPFWGGTYFPKEPRGNYPSFTMVLNALADAWDTKHAEVLQQADTITSTIRERLGARAEPAQIGPDQISAALTRLMSMDDPTWGGFGSAPKFPQPVYLEFLLDALPTIKDEARRTEVETSLRRTLDRMALGGVFDQVGGGFHRYSTDEKWLIPHFEKMLYDNAQLLDVYARAADLFHDDFYARVARRTAEYAMREMRAHGDGAGAAEPGFFSAQDAEVAGREGQNYLWKKDEIRAALPAADADFAIKVYRLDEGPNFRDPHHPEDVKSNVLWMRDRPEALASALKMTTAEFLARLDRVNAALYAVRAKRPQPRTDDKVIAGWNGLMIAGLADAGRLLDAPKLTRAAADAADFILTKMRADTGELARAWRVGSAGALAVFEDYAFVIRGLLALDRAGAGVEPSAETGGDHGASRYLSAAIELADTADRLFGDAEHGGYFDTAPDQSDLIVRTRSVYDGAVPSGQSVMIHNLLTLAQRTGEARFLDAATRTLASMSQAIAQAPLGPVESTRALIAFLRLDRASESNLLAEFGMGAEAPAFAPEAKPESPVQVFASADSAVVSAGKPATVELEIRVADGWHINAHEPGVDGLEPLSVRIEGGAGVRAVVEYPKGESLNVEWAPQGERPLVHEGSVRLSVRLERTDEEWAGEPTIVVDYQACTDRMCAEPAIATLRVKILPE